MEYLDVDLEIGAGLGRDYPVVVRSKVGEARLTMRFPYDEVVLESRLKDLRIALLLSLHSLRKALSDEERAIQDFGAPSLRPCWPARHAPSTTSAGTVQYRGGDLARG